MAGVQAAIDTYNATLQAGETALESAEDFFKDWAVAIWLDAEVSGTEFDFANIDFGTAITRGWTIEIANEIFFGDRGIYTGCMPPARWMHNKHVPGQTALPFGVSYETFRNPGPTFQITMDGDDTTAVAPFSGPTHWYAGYESQSDHILNVVPAVVGGDTFDFWTWYFIEEGWDFGFVEAMVGGDWVTVPLLDDSDNVVTTNDDPHGNNTEGNGLTGTSGGVYFVDEPQYIHLNGTVPAGATALRFRYSTDAAYLDTGWFVDDVMVNDSAASVSSSGDWYETTGEQDNNWVIQVVSACDLTPGVDSTGEIVDAAGFVYRFQGDYIQQGGFDTSCMRSTKDRFAVIVSNMPTGDLTFLDANYSFTLTNTGNAGGVARGNGKKSLASHPTIVSGRALAGRGHSRVRRGADVVAEWRLWARPHGGTLAASYLAESKELAESEQEQVAALDRLSGQRRELASAGSELQVALATGAERLSDGGLYVFALGPLRVERSGELVRHWGGAKAGTRQAEGVFAFLLDRGERGAAKDEIIRA